MAKGHNFPQLTLVGVVDADLGLATGDPRAAERTFQIAAAGDGARRTRRHGRARALSQTFQPDHPVLRALLSGDAERFYREEIRRAPAAGLPPFGRLAALVVSGKDRASAEGHARAIVRAAHALPQAIAGADAPGALPQDGDLVILGPPRRPSPWCAAAIVSACW